MSHSHVPTVVSGALRPGCNDVPKHFNIIRTGGFDGALHLSGFSITVEVVGFRAMWRCKWHGSRIGENVYRDLMSTWLRRNGIAHWYEGMPAHLVERGASSSSYDTYSGVPAGSVRHCVTLRNKRVRMFPCLRVFGGARG